jgi:hypothetical protein
MAMKPSFPRNVAEVWRPCALHSGPVARLTSVGRKVLTGVSMPQRVRRGPLLGLVCALWVCCALASHKDHSYKPQELVALYANKAGPFHNPRHVHSVPCPAH